MVGGGICQTRESLDADCFFDNRLHGLLHANRVVAVRICVGKVLFTRTLVQRNT